MTPSRHSTTRLFSPTALLLGAFLVLLPVTSRATMVLDQVASPNGDSFIEGLDLRGYQSFTVGVTGQLTEIDMWVVDPGADLGYLNSAIDVSNTFAPSYDTQYPGDGFTYLARATSPYPPNYQDGDPLPAEWVPFVLSNPLQVTAGETLYFSLDAGMFTPVWGTSGSYPNGSLVFICVLNGCSYPFGTMRVAPGTIISTYTNMAYRTWVVTPEPPVLALLAISGLGIGVRKGRSTRECRNDQ